MSFFKELKRRNVFRVGIAYTVATWLLIQVTDTVFPRIGLPDSAVTLVIALLAIGFIPALIFAWAFEMTPEGIKREKDIDRTQSITPTTGRKLDRMIIGILTVAVAYLLIDRVALKGSEPFSQQAAVQVSGAGDEKRDLTPVAMPVKAGPSIAVLPFVNMSGDQENEYFSDGLTETLLHMLAQLPDLKVAARTSSFAFKGQNKGIQEIGAALSVAHVLEGSVQKAGNRVRITAQLIRADDGFHVWSQSYDRTLEDIFAIQDEIAKDVAVALDSSLLGGASKTIQGVATANLTAYESYLKGLEQQAIYSYSSLANAKNHFKQALAHDPGFTDARLALIRNYLLERGTGLINDPETRKQIAPLIQQVRQTQPENLQARAFELAFELQNFSPAVDEQEIESKVAELRGMLPQIPGETYIRSLVAQVLNYAFKQPDQAIEVLQAGLLIDPMDADLHRQLGAIYREKKQLDEALASLLRAQQLAPDNPNSYGSLAYLEEARNNLPAALEWRRRAAEVDPQDHELAAEIAIDLYQLELPEEADPWYARVVALAPDSAVTQNVELQRYLARHETDKALEQARSMITNQIDLRRGAFDEAAFIYQSLMMEAGRSREAYDFLVSVRPDITQFEVMPEDMQGAIMQWFCLQLMTGFESFETRKEAWMRMAQNLDNLGFPWRGPDDWGSVEHLVVTGDIDAATNEYLEFKLSKPLAENLELHRLESKIFLADVYADPRVIARHAEIQKEYEEIREQVRQMLLQPEWNQ